MMLFTSRNPFLDRMRYFNKHLYNHITLLFAGQRWLAVVHHQGRRSGRAYATPVYAERTRDGFIIPLPYGTAVDWCQNLLAAGSGTIQYEGKNYPVVKPAIVTPPEALPQMAARLSCVFRLVGIRQYLRVEHLVAL